MKFVTALLALIVGVSICKAASPSYQSFEPTQFSYVTGHLWIKDSARMTNPVFNTSFSLSGATYTDNGTTLLRNGVPVGGGVAPIGTPPFLAYWDTTNHLDESSLQVLSPTTVSFVTLTGQELDVSGAGTNEFNNGQFTNWLYAITALYAGAQSNLTVNADNLRYTSGLADNATNVATRIGSSTSWANGSLLAFGNSTTNVAGFTPFGGLWQGNFDYITSTFHGPLLKEDTFQSWASLDIDGTSVRNVMIHSLQDTNFTAEGYVQINTQADTTNTSSAEIKAAVAGIDTRSWILRADPTDTFGNNTFQFSSTAGNILTFTPTIQDAGNSVAYSFGTDKTLSTSGALLMAVQNNTTNKFTVAYDGSVSAAGTVTPGTYTVATLPVGVSGSTAWCSDALTPEGSGAQVSYNGTAWITVPYGQTATTNVYDYLLSCLASGWAKSTTLSEARLQDEPAGIDPIGAVNTQGSGASFSAYGAESGVRYWQVGTGTTTNGYAIANGPMWLPTAGDYLLMAWRLKIAVLADAANVFYFKLGADTALTTVGDATEFLYDPWNITGHGQSYTNNIICLTKKTGSTYADSGLTPTGLVYDKLAIIVNGTSSARFYVNGTCVATNVANIPTASQFTPVMGLFKSGGSTGTTDRGFRLDWQYSHIRWNAARGLWP